MRMEKIITLLEDATLRLDYGDLRKPQLALLYLLLKQFSGFRSVINDFTKAKIEASELNEHLMFMEILDTYDEIEASESNKQLMLIESCYPYAEIKTSKESCEAHLTTLSKDESYKEIKLTRVPLTYLFNDALIELARNDEVSVDFVQNLEMVGEKLELPDELSLKIFQHLTLDEICRCLTLSKSWRRLGLDKTLWGEGRLNEIKRPTRDDCDWYNPFDPHRPRKGEGWQYLPSGEPPIGSYVERDFRDDRYGGGMDIKNPRLYCNPETKRLIYYCPYIITYTSLGMLYSVYRNSCRALRPSGGDPFDDAFMPDQNISVYEVLTPLEEKIAEWLFLLPKGFFYRRDDRNWFHLEKNQFSPVYLLSWLRVTTGSFFRVGDLEKIPFRTKLAIFYVISRLISAWNKFTPPLMYQMPVLLNDLLILNSDCKLGTPKEIQAILESLFTPLTGKSYLGSNMRDKLSRWSDGEDSEDYTSEPYATDVNTVAFCLREIFELRRLNDGMNFGRLCPGAKSGLNRVYCAHIELFSTSDRFKEKYSLTKEWAQTLYRYGLNFQRLTKENQTQLLALLSTRIKERVPHMDWESLEVIQELNGGKIPLKQLQPFVRTVIAAGCRCSFNNSSEEFAGRIKAYGFRFGLLSGERQSKCLNEIAEIIESRMKQGESSWFEDVKRCLDFVSDLTGAFNEISSDQFNEFSKRICFYRMRSGSMYISDFTSNYFTLMEMLKFYPSELQPKIFADFASVVMYRLMACRITQQWVEPICLFNENLVRRGFDWKKLTGDDRKSFVNKGFFTKVLKQDDILSGISMVTKLGFSWADLRVELATKMQQEIIWSIQRRGKNLSESEKNRLCVELFRFGFTVREIPFLRLPVKMSMVEIQPQPVVKNEIGLDEKSSKKNEPPPPYSWGVDDGSGKINRLRCNNPS